MYVEKEGWSERLMLLLLEINRKWKQEVIELINT